MYTMPDLIPSTTLLNNALRTTDGEKIGSVEEVFIDPVYGRVACVVIALANEANLASQYRPLPPSLIRYSPGDGFLVTDLAEQMVKSAPYVEQDQLSSPPDRNALEEIYKHYGQKPYWQ